MTQELHNLYAITFCLNISLEETVVACNHSFDSYRIVGTFGEIVDVAYTFFIYNKI